ncbi:MAG: hypothetical protein AAF152_16065 [Cyanobacteria bacterium P01_A01_bin.114]
MKHLFEKHLFKKTLGAGIAGLATLVSGPLLEAGWAQSYPACPPPAAGEYLLLVRGDTEAERERALSVLPADNPVVVCNYVGEVVVRAGGFTNLEAVNSWSLYLNDIEGFETVVAQPADNASTQTASSPAEPEAPDPETPDPETPDPETPEPVAQPLPAENVASAPTAGATVEQTAALPTAGAAVPDSEAAYDPKTLGSTYVVLVDYGEQPEIAESVQQTLGQSVGLAVYRQQPYLLALTTTDSTAAADLLQTLTSENYSAILVDGEGVIRLVSSVTLP